MTSTHDYAALKAELESHFVVANMTTGHAPDLQEYVLEHQSAILAALEAAQQVDPEWKRLRLTAWEDRALKAEEELQQLHIKYDTLAQHTELFRAEIKKLRRLLEDANNSFFKQ